MFNRILPNGIKLSDVVLWLDGLGGTYADRKSKTAYSATDITKRADIKGGKELIFNGSTSFVSCGAIGNVNTISFFVYSNVDTNYMIDLDGSSNLTSVSTFLTTTNITSPTTYINGVSGQTKLISGIWNHVAITFPTDINCTNVILGKVGSGYFDGSMTNILMFNKVLNSTQIGQLSTDRVSSVLAQLQDMGNLTFFKDYSSGTSSINADYSLGSATGTFSSARSATTPATYFTNAGVLTTTTTSNQIRFTGGFYDHTGFVSRPGIIMEPSSTNLVPISSGFDDASWSKTNVTVSADSTTSPDGTSNADTLTSTLANGTVLLLTAVTAQTFSVFLKRKTGTGNIDITADGGTAWSTVTLYTDRWVRVSVTAASALQVCGIRIVTSGDEVYAYGAQFEAQAYATTLIPTTSVALTRSGDVHTFTSASNRTAATESIFVKFTLFGNLVDFTNSPRVLDSNTKRRTIVLDGGNSQIDFFSNLSDTGTAVASTSTIFLKGKSLSLAFTCQSTGNPNQRAYNYGQQEGTKNIDFTSPAWGSTFYIFNSSLGAGQPGGIVESIAFYSDMKSDDDVAEIKIIMDSLSESNSGGLEFHPLSAPSDLISPQITTNHTFMPVRNINIAAVNLTIDGSVRKYLGYDSNPGGSQIRLYYSEIAEGPYTAYSGNPILLGGGNIYRWPSTLWDGTTIHLFNENELNQRMERWTSTDGINFTKQSNITIAHGASAFMNVFAWRNPNNNLYYLLHKESSTGPRKIWSRSSASIAGLDTATDTLVLTDSQAYPATAAAMAQYYDGTRYWLFTEGDAFNSIWKTYAFYSSSVNSGYVAASNNPIMINGEACAIPFYNEDGSKAFLAFSRDANGAGSTWYGEVREILQ